MELNERQARAVESDKRKILCLAGPGTGKTRVLTERVLWQRARRRLPLNAFLAVTFTRKAAEEMRARLQAAAPSDTGTVNAGTLHAKALEILRQFGDEAGWRGDRLTIYSEWQTERLSRFCADDLGLLHDGRWNARDRAAVRDSFTKWAEHLEWPAAEYPPGSQEHTLHTMVVQQCRNSNGLTFSLMLDEAKNLVSKSAYVRRRYLNYIREVLVDEAQDLTPGQVEFVKALSKNARLFAVGDPDQCIYGFRGVHPHAADWLAKWELFVRLRENYRSVEPLVRASQALIGHNPHIHGVLGLQATVPTPIHLSRSIIVLPGRSEAISKEIEGLLAGLYLPRDIAVLSRTNVLADAAERAIVNTGLPVRRIGSGSLLRGRGPGRDAWECFHSGLRAMANPHDAVSFRCAARVFGMDEKEFAAKHWSARRKRSAYTITTLLEGEGPAFNGLRGRLGPECPTKLALVELGAVARAAGFPFGARIYRSTMKLMIEHGLFTLGQYLDWLALQDIQSGAEDRDDDEEVITVSTVHAAKGLEWPVVFLAGFNEGQFPHVKALDAGDLEEERRIAYVGMTRAQEILYINVRDGYNLRDGTFIPTPPSRFLAELGGLE